MWIYITIVSAIAIWYRNSIFSWNSVAEGNFRTGFAWNYIVNPQELLFLLFDKGTNVYTYSRLCYNQIGLKFPKLTYRIKEKPKSKPKISKILYIVDPNEVRDITDADINAPIGEAISLNGYRIQVNYEADQSNDTGSYIIVLTSKQMGDLGVTTNSDVVKHIASISHGPPLHHATAGQPPSQVDWDEVVIEGQDMDDDKLAHLQSILLKYAGPSGDFYESVYGDKTFSKEWLLDTDNSRMLSDSATIKIYDTLGLLLHQFN